MTSSLRPAHGASAAPHDPAWTVVRTGDDPTTRRVDEALFTVANGHVGTRGTREEDGPGTEPLVMVAGVFRTEPGDIPRPLPGPRWYEVSPAGADPTCERRTLDLRGGVLWREGPSGLRTLRFASLARPHLHVMRMESPQSLTPAPDLLCWEAHGDQGGITAATWTDRRVRDGVETVDRIAVILPSRGEMPTGQQVQALLQHARAEGVDRLLTEHQTTWEARWATARVAIDGDPELEEAVRFGLFHLMSSVADEEEAVVGARGLTGPSYAGHVFWDADVFVLPFVAATHAPSARAMLEYRLRRLGAARARALAEGRAGARFPWESATDGSEATPPTVRLLDGTNEPTWSAQEEEHIVADVAWAAWQYRLWSGDHAFLRGAGAPLLVDTARWWASSIELDADGTAHLRGVMGPDEYHHGVDDNMYTNVLARWNLRCAADLVARDDHTTEEAARWRELANRLVTGLDTVSGVHEQFTGYHDLDPMVAIDLAPPPVAADLLLGPAGVAATQLVKQADVLMAHHLVPHELPARSLERDLDHYLPRTVHGSSLSPAIHASLLARLGRPDQALDLLRLAARLDLDDRTGTTAGGVHLATMGGVWQALVMGFLGLRPRRRALAVDPRPLPWGWERLEVRVRYHGETVRLVLEPAHLDIRAEHPVPIAMTGLDGHPRVTHARFHQTTGGWREET